VIISFEGGEGVGKSTHSKLLCNHLQQRGLPRLSLREPGGSPFSERLRPLFFEQGLDNLTELLLVLSSRRENITKLIEPALAEGRVVVIDRFIDSTLVYQGVLGGIGIEKTRMIMELTGTWREPDLTFVLDIDPARALQRIKPSDKFENQGLAFHERIRKSFLELASGQRHVIIDGDREREEVSRDIIAVTDSFLHA